MKVLIINGSPRIDGNNDVAIKELVKSFEKNKVEAEVIKVGNHDVRGCMACNYCFEHGKCVYNDLVNSVAQKFKDADGIIVTTPVYYANANATLLAFMQRLFYSTSTTVNKSMKVGAGVVVCRRGGASATFDELNKFFTISGMPIASSQYWNSVHGRLPGEATQDEEGLQTMRTLANNMTFLMKSIELGKKEYGLPENESITFTNFIR